MKKSVITIDDTKIDIKEITPRVAVELIANAKEIFENPDLDVMKFITDKFDLVVDLTKSFITIHGDADIADIGFSDIDKIIEEFKVVNESFLDKLNLMGMTTLDPVTQEVNSDLLITKKQEKD